jgi:sulfopyruvate decarboxylase alpha subunit
MDKANEAPARPAWPDEVFDVLRSAGIRQVGYVPDAGHSRLIERCLADNRMKAVRLTTEEEGVALATGAWLGGERTALLMQSSGAGNCINMLSIVQECRIPLLLLVTMRGDWGEFNPWQVTMGEGTEAALAAAGVIVKRVDDVAHVAETAHAAAALAFGSTRAVAVVIGQRVVGFKEWK